MYLYYNSSTVTSVGVFMPAQNGIIQYDDNT